MNIVTSARAMPLLHHTYVCVAATVILALSFIVLEPVVSAAASANDIFTVRQQINEEISFTVNAADVVMNGAIGGITGGVATGTTQTVVRTNSAQGYNMTIAFSNSPAMQGETTGNTSIRDYGTSTAAEPTMAIAASTSAQFAYTVTASTTSDVDPSFRHNSSTCGHSGGTNAANTCFKGPDTSPFTIINRATSAGTGATTTMTFVVVVPSNPALTVDEDYYTATATLTAVTN